MKKGLKIVPVANVDEVLAQALARRPEPIEWEEPPEPAGAAVRREQTTASLPH